MQLQITQGTEQN